MQIDDYGGNFFHITVLTLPEGYWLESCMKLMKETFKN
jgi:hypothetical protein